MISTEGAFPPE